MATEWELAQFCLLPEVKDADLSIRDSLAEVGLWVQLFLTIHVTLGWGSMPKATPGSSVTPQRERELFISELFIKHPLMHRTQAMEDT